MSRSRKKTPLFGNTCSETEKDNKRKANRKFRRKVKVQINKGHTNLCLMREVSNVWDFDKD